MISCICVTGSTKINAHVRADLLWRMVNSMHKDPGHRFELIIVDNCHANSVHREAIDQIFDTYRTVTHVVRNRINAYHGGGVNQGMAMATGNILVQITDDLEWEPGWLKDLTLPLLHSRKEKYIVAPLPGHNTKCRKLDDIEILGSAYEVRENAAAYCWGFHRTTWKAVGYWQSAHFADTKWANAARRLGYRFVLPRGRRIARETNLNYLRPWDYRAEKGINAHVKKREYIESMVDVLSRQPLSPTTRWPLRNPEDQGPEKYTDEWLREQGVDLKG